MAPCGRGRAEMAGRGQGHLTGRWRQASGTQGHAAQGHSVPRASRRHWVPGGPLLSPSSAAVLAGRAVLILRHTAHSEAALLKSRISCWFRGSSSQGSCSQGAISLTG